MSATTQRSNGVAIYYHDMRSADDVDIEGEPFSLHVRRDDPHIPAAVFEEVFRHVATDAGAELETVYDRWNAGSRRECEQFRMRECLDCAETFEARRSRGGLRFDVREHMVEEHERKTGHTVEEGTRSLMVGDIVFVDGEAYLCAPFGWVRQAHLDGGHDAS